jgi:formylmethanofuran dehydrogenase subunit C
MRSVLVAQRGRPELNNSFRSPMVREIMTTKISLSVSVHSTINIQLNIVNTFITTKPGAYTVWRCKISSLTMHGHARENIGLAMACGRVLLPGNIL